MFHCLRNVVEPKKHNYFLSHLTWVTVRGGGEAEMESGHTFIRFFKPFPYLSCKKKLS